MGTERYTPEIINAVRHLEASLKLAGLSGGFAIQFDSQHDAQAFFGLWNHEHMRPVMSDCKDAYMVAEVNQHPFRAPSPFMPPAAYRRSVDER